MLFALCRQAEGDARYPSARFARNPAERNDDILGHQDLAVALFHVAVGVESLGVLAHHDEIERADFRGNALIGPGRPNVGEEIEVLAEERGRIELALRGIEVERRGRAEDQSVGRARFVQKLRPYGRAVALETLVARDVLDQFELERKALRRSLEHNE